MKHIAIFASGNGTNAEAIIRHFRGHPYINVALICSNRSQAFVLERAKTHGIPSLVFSRDDLKEFSWLEKKLDEYNISFIILAGFLLLLPVNMIRKYPDRILNIHPALLPKYGGKGMYGQRVHETVIRNGENQSGITIHYVNENYDEGRIIFQASCRVEAGDTAELLAERVHQLEHAHYPGVIEKVVMEEGII